MVSLELINIIRDLYSKAKSCIRVNNNLTDWFETTIGVRQGCLLSPDLFNQTYDIWMKETISDDWTKSIILTMPKKGDITKCENYWTISLINHSSKILLEIIRSRIKPYVEAILAEAIC